MHRMRSSRARQQIQTTLAVWRISHEHRKPPHPVDRYRSSFPWPQRQQLDRRTGQLTNVVFLNVTYIVHDTIARTLNPEEIPMSKIEKVLATGKTHTTRSNVGGHNGNLDIVLSSPGSTQPAHVFAAHTAASESRATVRRGLVGLLHRSSGAGGAGTQYRFAGGHGRRH